MDCTGAPWTIPEACWGDASAPSLVDVFPLFAVLLVIFAILGVLFRVVHEVKARRARRRA